MGRGPILVNEGFGFFSLRALRMVCVVASSCDSCKICLEFTSALDKSCKLKGWAPDLIESHVIHVSATLANNSSVTKRDLQGNSVCVISEKFRNPDTSEKVTDSKKLIIFAQPCQISFSKLIIFNRPQLTTNPKRQSNKLFT